jgi:hypothetical protein
MNWMIPEELKKRVSYARFDTNSIEYISDLSNRRYAKSSLCLRGFERLQSQSGFLVMLGVRTAR